MRDVSFEVGHFLRSLVDEQIHQLDVGTADFRQVVPAAERHVAGPGDDHSPHRVVVFGVDEVLTLAFEFGGTNI